MKHICKIISLAVVVAVSLGNVMGQSKTITIEQGAKAFTASTTALPVATSFMWFLNGTAQTETSATFSQTWSLGDYWLAVAGVANGCSGDSMSFKISVVSDITQGTTVVWNGTPSPVCPPSNTNPGGGMAAVSVTLSNYTLNGENYSVIYTIDGLNPTSSGSLTSETNGAFNIAASGLTAGDHTVKIVKLIYGATGNQVKDYSNSANAPVFTLKVSSAPVINDIDF